MGLVNRISTRKPLLESARRVRLVPRGQGVSHHLVRSRAKVDEFAPHTHLQTTHDYYQEPTVERVR